MAVLTVQMLLFGSNHFFRGGFADDPGEALTRERVSGRGQPVVQSLSGHGCVLLCTVGGRTVRKHRRPRRREEITSEAADEEKKVVSTGLLHRRQ